MRQLNGFITGFHIYTSTFSVTRFSLSKKVSVEHLLFIGQQYNEANNLFNINCHTRMRNGNCLFFAHFLLPSIKGQLHNNNNNNNNNNNINDNNNSTNGMIRQ